ncbi:MAG: GNAT family N-acetyltransferase [Fimbriimonadaceae bacterium]|nr:GNAT family N-acetyltransferase [Fimbriimonadaceae bacterium]
MTVRLAARTDATAIAGLASQLGYEPSVAHVGRALGRATNSPERAVFVAEDSTGSVIGWTAVVLETTLTDAPYGLIQGLVVDASFRGEGIGRALLETARDWTFARGAESLRVRANVVRTDAHAFYGRLGFVRVKDQALFRLETTANGPVF